MKDVELKISFEDLLGRKRSEMPDDVRRTRWELWKALAGPDAVQYWQPEECGGCIHLREDWCARMELPAAVNPILSYRHGMPGMACMGAGKELTRSEDQ